MNVAGRRGNKIIAVEDLLFCVRKDRGKLARLRSYVSWKDVRIKAKESQTNVLGNGINAVGGNVNGSTGGLEGFTGILGEDGLFEDTHMEVDPIGTSCDDVV